MDQIIDELGFRNSKLDSAKHERTGSGGKRLKVSSYNPGQAPASPGRPRSPRKGQQLGTDYLLSQLKKKAELKPPRKLERSGQSLRGTSLAILNKELLDAVLEPDSAMKKPYKQEIFKRRSKKRLKMANEFENHLQALDFEANAEKKKLKQASIIKDFIIGAQSSFKNKCKMIDQVDNSH